MAASPEKLRERRRRYYLTHKKESLERYNRWYKNNKEKHLEYQRDYYHKNKEAKKEYAKKYRASRKREQKDYSLKRLYGVTLAEFEVMCREQGNRCAICRSELTYPVLDHDHALGHVRKVLCRTCNTGLGAFRDSEELLTSAIQYLRENRNGTRHSVSSASSTSGV